MELARKKQECVFCNVQFVRRKCLAFFHCVTLVTSIIAIFCVIFFENFCQIKCFSRPFQLPMHRVQKFHLLKVSFHFISANLSIILIVIHIYTYIYIYIYTYIYIHIWPCDSLSLSIYILYNIYNIYTCVYVFSKGVTLVYAHLNWPQLVSLSYLEGGLLVIMIDCMIFLWSFLDLARMSMSSVSFLA